MSADLGIESSLYLRTRRSVAGALRKDAALLLTDAEINEITRLLVSTDGGVWRQVVAEYEALLHEAREEVGKKEIELGRAHARIADLEARLAAKQERRGWRR